MSMYVFLVFITYSFILRSYVAHNFISWKSCDMWTLWDNSAIHFVCVCTCVYVPRENAGGHWSFIEACG